MEYAYFKRTFSKGEPVNTVDLVKINITLSTCCGSFYLQKPALNIQPCYLYYFCCSVVSYSLRPHGLQHARLSCPSLSPGVFSNSCPLSQGCYLTISSSVVSFSSCRQSFPASGSFPVRWLFISGGQSTGASALASVFPMNIQG